MKPSDIVWFFEESVIATSNDEKYSFSENRLDLNMSSLTFNDRGSYRVTAVNDAGQDDTVIVLDVQG